MILTCKYCGNQFRKSIDKDKTAKFISKDKNGTIVIKKVCPYCNIWTEPIKKS